jgi:hypothetical protein
MITTLLAAFAVLLSLWLPTFPQGLTPMIAVFLGLTGLAGVGGALRSRAARVDLVLLLPWAAALAAGVIVGLARANSAIQLLEDLLPYLLFTLGFVAGRGAQRPRWLLVAALFVAVADSVISLARMPSYDLSRIRSTFFYFRIIVGTPLVGLYIVSMIPRLERERVLGGEHPQNARLWRRAAQAIAALLVIAVIATVSRGMIGALMIGVGAATYLRKPSRGLSLAVMAGLGVLLFAPMLWEFGAHYLRLGSVSTVSARMREIIHCLQVFSTMPVLGAGLGAEFVVDSHVVSYVHNMVAYHLWKFGLLGSMLLSLPLVAMTRQAFRAPHELRAVMLGGAGSVLAYLVTCASYKNYTLVPMLGMVVGASFSLLAALHRQQRAASASLPVSPT